MKLSCSVVVGTTILDSPECFLDSPNILHSSDASIEALYTDHPVRVHQKDGNLQVCREQPRDWIIQTDKKRPTKLGLMLVGWGGNNGSTLTASLLANKAGLSWETRKGKQDANYLGSLVMASTVQLGFDHEAGTDVNVKMHDLVSFVHPDDIVLGGWDISGLSLGDALLRSRVLESDLIRQVKPDMDKMAPLPSIYSPSFIAGNQADRADNIIKGTKQEQLDVIRKNIRDFRTHHNLDKVIVMWSANTERFCKLQDEIHFGSDALLQAISADEPEISPSTIFGVASVLEGCPFINGSPQNTFVPALVKLASERAVPIAGDDFKSGQTKIKSVLVDFLISSGIKPLSIVSYNHLGNNDGKNLAEAAQFRSKEISKRGVVEDMVGSNPVLYPVGKGGPDHKVVIEYVPNVGDSKRAMDEYESEIFMGGRNILVMHNTCEDSLLAAPLMLDLVLLMEFFGRVRVAKREPDGNLGPFEALNSVTSLLAFCLKAPLFPEGTPIVNALGRQRRAIETILRASVGLPPLDDLSLAQRL